MRRRSSRRGLAENHCHDFMDDLLRDPRLATSRGRYPLRRIIDFVVSHTFPTSQLTRRPVQASTTCFAFDMLDRKSTRLNSSHSGESRMPSSA